jgi:16S rRNA processing protein RimM
VSRPEDSNHATGSPSPLVGEGGKRRHEPGEGSGAIAKAPSPALDAAHLERPLPKEERVTEQADKTICVARIGAAHGVRGAVKLWTFTDDPFAVKGYGPLWSKDGTRKFEVTSAREARGHLVATLKGVATRDEAERLNGLELYVAREKLPETGEGEYYHADLIGLAAVTVAGEPIGRVIAIHNFGAGDIIEIGPPQGATMLLPFTNAVVPTVDVAGGRVVVDLPGEIDGDDPDTALGPSTGRRREGGDP